MQETDAQYLRLLDLLSAAAEPFPWRPEELRQLWLHLLRTSILVSIATTDPIQALRAAQLCKQTSPQINSLADLMEQSNQDVELLEIVATSARSQVGNPSAVLPEPIANAISDLMLLHLRSSSKLPIEGITDRELTARIEALASADWIDAQTQQIIASRRHVLPPVNAE